MVSKTELHMNYTAITHLPIVQRTLKCVSRLTRENKELKKENDMLKKMIDTLFDKISNNITKQEPVPEVHIKKEKVVIDISEEPENITYKLDDPSNNVVDKPFTYWEESEEEEFEDTEKIANCDICCKDKSFETYYMFTRGGKQELYSCVKCWENRKTRLVGETWKWSHHTFPGPAFYITKEKGEEYNVEAKESVEEEEVEVEEESEEEEEVEVEVEESEEEEEVEESEEKEEVEVEVEESEEEEEVEVEVEESEEEEEVEVEVEESEEEEEVEVEVEESEEEEEVEVEVEESEEEEEVEVEVEVEESEEGDDAEEENEEEVYEVTIKNKSYYTTNETDGPIYAILDDEDIGDQIGEFKEGKPTFYRKTKK
jgi:hypothetical protein